MAEAGTKSVLFFLFSVRMISMRARKFAYDHEDVIKYGKYMYVATWKYLVEYSGYLYTMLENTCDL